MDKILRNVSEPLWREVKAQAALDSTSMKEWVERALAEKLGRPDLISARQDRRRKK